MIAFVMMAAAPTLKESRENPAGGNGLWVKVLKVAVVAIIVGGSAWLLLAHSEWFQDPKQVKLEVLAWGVWGPLVYMTLYAVGPSFLVPGAVMTIAGASRIVFRDYLWATLLGMIPGTILFAFLGDALWHPESPRFFLALLLIAVSVGCGELWRRRSAVKIEVSESNESIA